MPTTSRTLSINKGLSEKYQFAGQQGVRATFQTASKKIYIPQEVFEEVVTRGEGRAGQKEVEGAKWIEVIPVKDKNKVQEFIDM